MILSELVREALLEDMPQGDVTTDPLKLDQRPARALIVAKEDLVLSGIHPVNETFRQVDSSTSIKWYFDDGDFIWKGQTLASVGGRISSLLKAERVALNFLGHLSGVATLTHCFVKQVEHTRCKIIDTRKTLPLFRKLEKAAVVHGRGFNHRMNLSEGVLLKDNHIKAFGDIEGAVQRIRAETSRPIEVECADLAQVEEAVKAKVERILLDNMGLETLKKAIELIPSSIQIEASGNMTLDRVSSVAELGVHFISVGALTHSAPSADFSMKIEEA